MKEYMWDVADNMIAGGLKTKEYLDSLQSNKIKMSTCFPEFPHIYPGIKKYNSGTKYSETVD